MEPIKLLQQSEMGAKKINILSTSLLPDTAVRALEEHHFTVEQHPFIYTQSDVNQETRERIEHLSTQPALIFFTSAQAVKAIMSVLGAAPNQWDIACISGSTADAVAQFWGQKAIVAKGKDAQHLLQDLNNVSIQKATFFCGNLRLDLIPQGLEEKGIVCEEIMVYKTVHTPTVIRQSPQAIMFFSPSGVESYLSANIIPKDAIVFTIGSTTASAVAQRVNNPIMVAPLPDKQLMVQQLIHYFKTTQVV